MMGKYWLSYDASYDIKYSPIMMGKYVYLLAFAV